MSTSDQPSEAELQAAYEAEVKKIRVEQILLEQVVSLVNLGMRRTGLSPGTEDERDVGQVRTAIEAVRALLPLIEQSAPPQARAIREALTQLQLAFVRLGGAAGPATTSGPDAPPAPFGADAPPAPSGAGPERSPQSPPPPPAGGSGPPTPPGPEPEAPKPGEAGPAQRSGRLWVPGQ
jgi:hypothetical protein